MLLHARIATRAGIVCAALAIAIAALSSAPTASRADETRKYGNALDWAPADAAFYSSSLRNKEQLDNIAHSKAQSQRRPRAMHAYVTPNPMPLLK